MPGHETGSVSVWHITYGQLSISGRHSFHRRERWMKVARAIAEVARAIGQELPAGDEELEKISGEIHSLVQGGLCRRRGCRELALQRSSPWRHSGKFKLMRHRCR